MSLLAVAAWLLLGGATPLTARAAPTSTPTLAAPARVPGIVSSPSPTARPTSTASPVPSLTPTPMPMLAPSPSVTTAVPLLAPSTPTLVHVATRAEPDSPDATADAAPDASADAAADDASAEDQSGEDNPADSEPPLDWRAFVPTDTADHLATMDRAARESGCGVPWHLLAAISRVESDFGRNMATSSAGAIGYGQFLPSSWQAFGSDGNAYDYRDALPAIAAYLCQAGLTRDPRAALFAYNHADWYVDLVLDLAVRYDRMAPGAPIPDVLNVGPAVEAGMPMHYAAGRDLRVQNRPRTLDGQADWLGVPWRGRSPGKPISAAAIETTTLSMVRATFGLPGDPPTSSEAADADALTTLTNQAWQGGLVALSVDPPEQWTIAEIRRHLERAQPVVVLLAARLLPGHPSTDPDGTQPVVVIGTTQQGMIYNDPSFSSSLGYGLELADADFFQAWQAASTPLQALAFAARPKPPTREAPLRQPEWPPVVAQVVPTPTDVPVPPTLQPMTVATLEAMPTLESAPTPVPIADAAAPVTLPAAAGGVAARPRQEDGDYSWLVILGAGVFVSAALVMRARRRRENVQHCT